jgi:hypothetical protein
MKMEIDLSISLLFFGGRIWLTRLKREALKKNAYSVYIQESLRLIGGLRFSWIRAV